MENILRQIETEDVVIFSEGQYTRFGRAKYLALMESLKNEGKLTGDYEDMMWIGSSGIKKFWIRFDLDKIAYETHIGKEFGISYETIIDMLKCYSLYICGTYIYRTIAHKVKSIIVFLTHYGDRTYSATETERLTIIDFLGFISTPDHMIEAIMKQILVQKEQRSSIRQLANFINYLAIDAEITEMYDDMSLSREDFIKWFPIYFWCKITFVLPLRATEMLVTPLKCITRVGEDVWLSVRRTQLKKGARRVYYDVDNDYRIFQYHVPDNKPISVIEKYIHMTTDPDNPSERRFLFVYGQNSTNEILSLSSFNDLLAEFVETRLVDNHKYDYARFAAGIKDFELVTAGDARPIAMANLFYQDSGADICRQLADHENIETSYGYYSNVSETVLASSIMKIQRELHYGREQNNSYYTALHEVVKSSGTETDPKVRSCSSPTNPYITHDLSDCVAGGHIEDCIGCNYYVPTKEALEAALADRKQKLDKAGEALMVEMAKGKRSKEDFDKLFLDAHTGITRYKKSCDVKAENDLILWHRYYPENGGR